MDPSWDDITVRTAPTQSFGPFPLISIPDPSNIPESPEPNSISPEIDHQNSYSREERLVLALADYFAQLYSYQNHAGDSIGPIVSHISKHWGVANSTLRAHILHPERKLRSNHNADLQILTRAEENALKQRLFFLDDFNVPADRALFYTLANAILHQREPYRMLGQNWIYQYIQRHEDCENVIVKTISTSRANAENWNVMEDFFWKLKMANDKYAIRPINTYNLDEKGYILGVGMETKRICRSIRDGSSRFKEARNRESCTVVETIAPDGFTLTPLIIFKGKNHLAGWHKEEKEEDYWYGYADKGYNNTLLCLEYIEKIFEPETASRAGSDWRLLIFDGFEAHIDYHLVDFCLQHKILPFCLPAHTSHILQPLDVGVFSALRTYYCQEVNSIHVPIDKNMFSNILVHARKKAFTEKNIKSGFRATGIYPYNPNRILDLLLLKEPILDLPLPEPPLPPGLQTPHKQLSFSPHTPITPRSIHNLYVEGLSTVLTTSPRSQKQRMIFSKFKSSAEKNAATVKMHEAGEEHLRLEVLQLHAKGKIDKRFVNSEVACVLEKGNKLVEAKRKRDEDKEEKSRKKRIAKAAKDGGNLVTVVVPV